MINSAQDIPFRKMNGLGNDFVVLDARARAIALTPEQIRTIANRKTGPGCDQLIIIEPSKTTHGFMRIHNFDGGEVEACGNAARCIADILMTEEKADEITMETVGGLLTCRRHGEDIQVDMGRPRFGWQDIPLAEEFRDTRMIELQIGPIDDPILHSPSVVNVGNPHCIFWVDDVDIYDLERFGPMLENHPIFPERANISLAQVTSPNTITLRVWERGVGQTKACGTAACAAGVAAARKKLTGRTVTVTLPGGPLLIEWREEDDHILMTGPIAYEYEDVLDPALLAEAAS